MKRVGWIFRRVLASVLCCIAAATAIAAVPLVGGKQTVAEVNGEPIRLEEFRRALDSLHERAGETMPSGRRNYSELLHHIINGKLILQEARNIGFDSLPEFKNIVKAFEKQTLRQILLARQVEDIRPDGRDVEKAYKESIREVKLRSYLFEQEEDARQAEEEIRSGSDYDNVMRRMASEGKAKGEEEGRYLKGKELLPEILDAVSRLTPGGASPVVNVSAGRDRKPAYTILMLEEVRYPDHQEAKEQAAREVLREQRLAAIKKYVETLKKKYVKIHKQTLNGLDYESKEPGMEKLLADRRVVAEIQGEKSIRVEDLSRALEQKFYHGVQQATTRRKVNREIPEVLNEMVISRVLVKEALRRKIDKTPESRQRVKEFQDELLFGVFVEKAINPGITPSDDAVRKFYDEHQGEFFATEMIRGEDLAFAAREDATDALEKLRSGADFKWVKENASGQVAETLRQRVFPPDGSYSPRRDLPGGAGEAIAGGRAGESRLHESPEGQFLILHILEVVPAKPYPFEAVKEQIRSRLFREQQQRTIDEWAGKLRAASKIRIFLTNSELEKIFVPAGGTTGRP